MTFETIVTAQATHYFIDGYLVPEGVYDALRPSLLFPKHTMPIEDAETQLAAIKAEEDAKPKAEQRGPYFALAINDAHPLRSDALAVHSKLIPAVVARNAKHGINVRYDRMGRPVFTDAAQRKKLMKLEGVRQQNSFYGA